MATADSTQSLSITTVEMSLDEARETDRLIKRHINTTRYLLLDMRDRKGWKALGYASFKDYGEKELGYKERHIYELVDAAEISLQLGYSAEDCAMAQPAERQLRPLKAVPEDERKAIWDEATRKAKEDGAKLTAQRVQDAVADYQHRIQALEAQLADATTEVKETPVSLPSPQQEVKEMPVALPESTPPHEEPTMSLPPIEDLPMTALRPTRSLHGNTHSATTASDASLTHRGRILAFRAMIQSLSVYLNHCYEQTGDPFFDASDDDRQEWLLMGEELHQIKHCIDGFIQKRPALTLIQGGVR